MGLETATFINQLAATNPIASDRKNQGDDHIRLVKTVLQASFPNLDRALYLQKVLSAAGNYAVLASNDKALLFMSSGGPANATLPVLTGAEVGWEFSLATIGAQPAYLVPPSGTIQSGALAVAKVRCSVPFALHKVVWTGTGWIHSVSGPGMTQPGALEIATSIPTGYGLANGQSLVRADHPELFAIWGTGFGAVDGTHFNAPDLRDRFPVAAGLAYGVGSTGGVVSHVLTAAEMPVHTHGVNDPGHLHGWSGPAGRNGTEDRGGGNFQPAVPGGAGNIWIGTAAANTDAANTGPITIQDSGAGVAHENRPPYFGLNFIFRLC